MNPSITRRWFLASASCAAGSLCLTSPRALFAAAADAAESAPNTTLGPIHKAVKFGMFTEPGSLSEKFALLREAGFDGVELDSPSGINRDEALAASKATGLSIHGVVDSVHWKSRLSDPSADVRQAGFDALITAISDAAFYGGSTVLLVPGRVNADKNETHDDVWHRSIPLIQKALPHAAKLGIRILIENVWNGFCHDPEQLAQYIDAIDSPHVGVYWDIGNHVKHGDTAEAIRTLGRRIVKLDVKDWGKTGGFGKIGEGDTNWPSVRTALSEIRYTGWATAEVAGGDRKVMSDIASRMDRFLLGKE